MKAFKHLCTVFILMASLNGVASYGTTPTKQASTAPYSALPAIIDDDAICDPVPITDLTICYEGLLTTPPAMLPAETLLQRSPHEIAANMANTDATFAVKREAKQLDQATKATAPNDTGQAKNSAGYANNNTAQQTATANGMTPTTPGVPSPYV